LILFVQFQLLIRINHSNKNKWEKTIFILKVIKQLQNAISKTKKLRPRVEFDRFGRYRVRGSKGDFYIVICKKSDNDYKSAECTCKGAEKDIVCYHAAALALHVGFAR